MSSVAVVLAVELISNDELGGVCGLLSELSLPHPDRIRAMVLASKLRRFMEYPFLFIIKLLFINRNRTNIKSFV